MHINENAPLNKSVGTCFLQIACKKQQKYSITKEITEENTLNLHYKDSQESKKEKYHYSLK